MQGLAQFADSAVWSGILRIETIYHCIEELPWQMNNDVPCQSTLIRSLVWYCAVRWLMLSFVYLHLMGC